MTLQKPVGEENPYVWFGCDSQTICNHTQGQVSGSIIYDPIESNKQVNNQLL